MNCNPYFTCNNEKQLINTSKLEVMNLRREKLAKSRLKNWVYLKKKTKY